MEISLIDLAVQVAVASNPKEMSRSYEVCLIMAAGSISLYTPLVIGMDRYWTPSIL